MTRRDKRIRSLRRLSILVIGGCGVAALLLAPFRYRKHRLSNTPQSLEPPRFDPSLLPSPPPVGLGPDTVEDFVRWIAAVPVSKAQLIRDQIAAVRGDDAVLAALLASLFQLPVADFGRHQLLLSILGELRHPKAVEPLVRFVNAPGDRVVPQPALEQSKGVYTSYLDYSAALQARAVEMLAFVRTPEALTAVLQAASGHSSRAVRLAALDAFIFNHDDSAEATERARTAARPEEAKLVGLPRREREFNAHDFDAKVLAFYQRHPEETPPNPGRGRLETHDPGPPRERRGLATE